MTKEVRGWYPTPGDPKTLQYWDGAQWTEDRHTITAPEPVADGKKRMSGPARGMIIGLIFTGLTVLLVTPVTSIGEAGSGERQMTGTVAEQEWEVRTLTGSSGSQKAVNVCSPVVEFVVNEQAYEARGISGSTVCATQLGEPKEILYTVANPNESNIKIDNTFLNVIWVLPALGTLIFVLSARVFAKRALVARRQRGLA